MRSRMLGWPGALTSKSGGRLYPIVATRISIDLVSNFSVRFVDKKALFLRRKPEHRFDPARFSACEEAVHSDAALSIPTSPWHVGVSMIWDFLRQGLMQR